MDKFKSSTIMKKGENLNLYSMFLFYLLLKFYQF